MTKWFSVFLKVDKEERLLKSNSLSRSVSGTHDIPDTSWTLSQVGHWFCKVNNSKRHNKLAWQNQCLGWKSQLDCGASESTFGL